MGNNAEQSGNALSLQGERAEGVEKTRLLSEAVETFRLALQVRDRRYLPSDWAITQNNLANAYFALQDWNNAAECYVKVLTIFPTYRQVFQRASGLYHDTLFKFSATFELKRRW